MRASEIHIGQLYRIAERKGKKLNVLTSSYGAGGVGRVLSAHRRPGYWEVSFATDAPSVIVHSSRFVDHA